MQLAAGHVDPMRRAAALRLLHVKQLHMVSLTESALLVLEQGSSARSVETT